MKTPKAHRQGIGDLYATPAHTVQVGDRLTWNYGGSEAPVRDVAELSPAYLCITEASYPRKVKRSTLLVVAQLHALYGREYRATLKDLRLNGGDNGSLSGIRAAITGYEQLLKEATNREELATLYGQRDAFQDYVTSRTRYAPRDVEAA